MEASTPVCLLDSLIYAGQISGYPTESHLSHIQHIIKTDPNPENTQLSSFLLLNQRSFPADTNTYHWLHRNVRHALIKIITTTPSDLAFRSEKAKQSALSPALDYIITRHLDSHIHTYYPSEGGFHKAI